MYAQETSHKKSTRPLPATRGTLVEAALLHGDRHHAALSAKSASYVPTAHASVPKIAPGPEHVEWSLRVAAATRQSVLQWLQRAIDVQPPNGLRSLLERVGGARGVATQRIAPTRLTLPPQQNAGSPDMPLSLRLEDRSSFAIVPYI